jgi:hypothetical protein
MYTMGKHGMTRLGPISGALTTLVLLFSMGSGPASAQEMDQRWLAWMGCWQPVAETASDDAADALLCFQPLVGDAGVELVSIQGGQISTRQTVHADGRQHDSSSDGCTGWDRGDFSARPGRVFLSSERVCDGDVSRTSTGLLTMVSPDEWVDVEVVTLGGQRTTWLARYRLAPLSEAEAAGFGGIAADRGMAVHAARGAAAANPSVDDVIEASRYVEAEGVNAWVAELDTPFILDADRLVRMADAGVPDDVIDMVIAVSYPSRFAVGRESERYSPGFGSSYGTPGGWGFSQPYYSSLFFSPFGFCSPYGYGFGYGGCRYGGYGYGGYGYGGYGYGGYGGPVVIYVDRTDSGGRVVNGQGYRRGESSNTAGGRRASPRGSVGGSSGSSAGGRSSTEPSRRTSTGRKAKRKDGGG